MTSRFPRRIRGGTNGVVSIGVENMPASSEGRPVPISPSESEPADDGAFAVGATACGSGTSTLARHCGQCPFWPMAFSGTRIAARQRGQSNSIMRGGGGATSGTRSLAWQLGQDPFFPAAESGTWIEASQRGQSNRMGMAHREAMEKAGRTPIGQTGRGNRGGTREKPSTHKSYQKQLIDRDAKRVWCVNASGEPEALAPGATTVPQEPCQACTVSGQACRR